MARPKQRHRQVDLPIGGGFPVVVEQWLMSRDHLHHFDPLVVDFLTGQLMLSDQLHVGSQLSWHPIEDFLSCGSPGGEPKVIQTPGLNTWLRVSP